MSSKVSNCQFTNKETIQLNDYNYSQLEVRKLPKGSCSKAGVIRGFLEPIQRMGIEISLEVVLFLVLGKHCEFQ